jgi:D-psicose/D-tagatose/L-ribulose 3-epimerase
LKPQAFQLRDREVIERFAARRRSDPRTGARRLALSWSNWSFGTEPLATSAARLARFGVRFIELHGNRYGADLGYRTAETRRVLDDHGLRVSGVCGMVSPDCELSSNKPHITQRSIDYFRRNIALAAELGGSYLLFGAGAVGRPQPYDASESARAADAIRIIAEDFARAGIRGAIEPIRAAEVSLVHTFAEAARLIDAVGHAGVRHIAGDVYHMLAGEEHIGATLLRHGLALTNLHLADSNRMALGLGMLDLDIVLMALYAIGYDADHCYCTAEPLGPGGDPYPQMWGSPDPAMLDRLVEQTARCFYEREDAILAAAAGELAR